ncbi:Uu.00g012420.m01.CDS01 [Anthostomella pinea]|uniref:Uu.00g012420.m01.CDS01 n=1 Tax=Anthostomella pinea TaxID=933095 RepID=A0AAI8VZ66_9PEZI|nr:Uu.00g012420.m01.CDS01 [Anthostomella pinea]
MSVSDYTDTTQRTDLTVVDLPEDSDATKAPVYMYILNNRGIVLPGYKSQIDGGENGVLVIADQKGVGLKCQRAKPDYERLRYHWQPAPLPTLNFDSTGLQELGVTESTRS